MAKKRIAVIGGGITGLSAAFYLKKEIEANQLDAEYVLYEASGQLGGKIQTVKRDGFTIEQGPDSFLARKKSASVLAKETGIEDKLIRNSSGQSYILFNDKLYPMPGGAILGIPTKWGPFLQTKLFSPAGKIRAAGDLVRPRVTQEGEDIALGEFFRKRLGNEVVDRLIDPLLSGIYAGDLDKLSMQATFPHFQQLEEKYRSLVLGMKSSIAKQGAQPQKNTKGKKAPGMFLSFKGGLQTLVDAVEKHLDTDSVKKNAVLSSINKLDGGYLLKFQDGSEDRVDNVIMATPHNITYDLLKDRADISYLNEMPSTSVATVVLAFPESSLKKDIDGAGFVVSRASDYSITACTWTHRKWEKSAPEGYALLRGYVGRAGDEEIVYKSDEEIVDAVLKDLSHIMEIDGKPEFHLIKRWKKSMPQYEVGHLKKLEDVYKSVEAELPGLLITGASFGGIGIPDCIDQGKAAAEKILSEAK